MKQPGPNHPIEISPFGGRVRVGFEGEAIADTSHALLLEEADYPGIFYIPRGDVHMEKLVHSGRVTHCPYKGDESSFSLLSSHGERARDMFWSYETHFPAVAAIAGHI